MAGYHRDGRIGVAIVRIGKGLLVALKQHGEDGSTALFRKTPILSWDGPGSPEAPAVWHGRRYVKGWGGLDDTHHLDLTGRCRSRLLGGWHEISAAKTPWSSAGATSRHSRRARAKATAHASATTSASVGATHIIIAIVLLRTVPMNVLHYVCTTTTVLRFVFTRMSWSTRTSQLKGGGCGALALDGHGCKAG